MDSSGEFAAEGTIFPVEIGEASLEAMVSHCWYWLGSCWFRGQEVMIERDVLLFYVDGGCHGI